jgi:hypothetical protein
MVAPQPHFFALSAFRVGNYVYFLAHQLEGADLLLPVNPRCFFFKNAVSRINVSASPVKPGGACL